MSRVGHATVAPGDPPTVDDASARGEAIPVCDADDPERNHRERTHDQ